MKLNNKGFTMVELLVAMAIMGLLIIMAFPTIRAIQSNNTSTKYKEYGKSALSASKLYVDSYEEDLFDLNEANAMKSIDLNDLVKKDLLKDISMSDSTCLNGSSVNIIKYKDDYTYCLNLICTTGGKEVYKELSNEGKCKDLVIHNIKYSATGQTGRTISVIQGNNHTVLTPGAAHITIPNGYKFVKWNSSIGKKKAGEVIEVNSDIEFTPEIESFKYKLRFDSSLSGAGTMTDQECKVGEPCKIKNNEFSKDYYSFSNYTYNSKTYNPGDDIKNDVNITSENQVVNVTASFRKNKITINYYSNGGSLQPNIKQRCSIKAGCPKNDRKCYWKTHWTEVSGCKAKSGLVQTVQMNFDAKNFAYDNNGMPNYDDKNGAALYMTRSGCTGTHFWHIGSAASGNKINEYHTEKNSSFATMASFANDSRVGKGEAFKKGDVTVDVFAGWNCPNSVTCAAGKYLPKNSSSCAACLSKYYCLGGTFKKNTSKDQGLTPCPTGYKNSPVGSSKITQCYMNVVNNHFVKKEKDSSSTPCSSGTAQVAHKVNYGNKSTCIELPKCTIKPSRKSNKLGWYRKNVTLTLETTGPYTKRGLDKTQKSTNGKTTASVTKEGTTTYYGYVENAVGNSTCSITIQLDKTPPTLKDYKYYVHNNVQSHSSANRLNQPSGSWPGKFKVKLRSVTSTDKLSGVYAYYMYFEPTVLVNTTIYRPSGKNIPNKTDTPLPLTSSDCKKVRHYVEEVGAYSTGYFCKKDDLINKVQEYPISVPSSADHYNFDWCGGIKVYDKAGNMITTSQGNDNNKKVANRSGMGSNSQCIKVNHANNNSTIFTFKKF